MQVGMASGHVACRRLHTGVTVTVCFDHAPLMCSAKIAVCPKLLGDALPTYHPQCTTMSCTPITTHQKKCLKNAHR